MVRLAIVDSDGKQLSPKDLTSAVDLQSIAEQARMMIRDCEQLASSKRPKSPSPPSRVPYS